MIPTLRAAYEALDAALIAFRLAAQMEADIMLRTYDPTADRPTVAEVARWGLVRVQAMDEVAHARAQVEEVLRAVQREYLEGVS